MGKNGLQVKKGKKLYAAKLINFVYSNNALGKLLLQKQSTIVSVSDTNYW